MKALECVKYWLLFQFMASAPLAMIAVFGYGWDRYSTAFLNSYGFSTAMVALYLYPFLWPASFKQFPFLQRLELATMNWIIWLSAFTEVTFQIPHNLMVRQFHEHQGEALEWPFFAYGLSDSRWSDYHGGTGLDPYVWFINVNDAALGLVVLVALLYKWHSPKERNLQATIILCIAVLFRDATLFRETVEYLCDMHVKGYPFTISDPRYHRHGIICLWLVNIVWLIAPVLSPIWTYFQITAAVEAHESLSSKKK
jgi:hypothetical protein